MREARIDIFCDPCGGRGRRVTAVHEGVLVAVGGKKSLQVDLCAQCNRRFIAPLVDLLKTFGVDPKTGTPATADMGQQQLDLPPTPTTSNDLFLCPCGAHCSTAKSFRTHGDSVHQVAKLIECPTCGYKATGVPLGSHRTRNHAYTLADGIEEMKQTIREKLGVAA